MKNKEKCVCCGRNNFKYLYSLKDRMYNLPGEYALEECKNCGLIKLENPPKREELSKHYPKDYYSFKKSSLSPRKLRLYDSFYSEKSSLFKRKILSPFKFIIRNTKIIKGGNFLDVGCGSGDFLEIMGNFGMDSYGVEPEGEKGSDSKRKIFHGELIEAKYPDSFFDVITMRHVFEHISNPKETLKELKRILKPSGFLIIDVPNSKSLSYKVFKQNWSQLDVPRHLFTYSSDNLSMLVKRIGFRIEEIYFNGTPFSFLISNHLSKNKKNISSSFIPNKLLLYFLMPFFMLVNYLKFGDQMSLTLRKEV